MGGGVGVNSTQPSTTHDVIHLVAFASRESDELTATFNKYLGAANKTTNKTTKRTSKTRTNHCTVRGQTFFSVDSKLNIEHFSAGC